MNLPKENINFWKIIEKDLATAVPGCIKNCLFMCGFGGAASIRNLGDEQIKGVEDFVRSKLKKKLQAFNIKESEFIHFFGPEFVDCQNEFEFTIGDRILLKEISSYVFKTDLEYFKPKEQMKTFRFHGDQVENQNCEIEISLRQKTKTHQFLNLLKVTADENSLRKDGGYRFDDKIKWFATYLRMLSGRLAYQTIYANLKCALPSPQSINRYISKSNCHVTEGILRCNELLHYLKDRNLPLAVSISEDATRITNRVQYDSRTNQIVGLVLPINKNNGLPIPFTFKARSDREILKHFSGDNKAAVYINVVIAQPLTIQKVAPFCLLLFGSDNKYTSQDVSNRWRFIRDELHKLGIKVLTISSDSDPKYNSSMRRDSLLGHQHEVLELKWFSCRMNFEKWPFHIQDPAHILTKLRNQFLKTIMRSSKFPIGKFFIRMQHLQELLIRFRKDKHNLTSQVLNPTDRQNVSSALRICDKKVCDMLRENIIGSEGTIKFLDMMREVYDSLMDPTLAPTERVYKIWYAVFVIRSWRHYVLNQKGLSMKENFLTMNAYVCIELNAHNLVLCLLHLKETKQGCLFLPWLFSSQPCEGIFRQARSYTTTYSTVANFSVLEMLSRISKIQLQNEITCNNETFTFPRIQNTNLQINQKTAVADLPTKEDIIKIIEMSKHDAIQESIRLGLLKKNETKGSEAFICRINLLDANDEIISKKTKANNTKSNDTKKLKMRNKSGKSKESLLKLSNVLLENYAHRFGDIPVPETSSYVEIDCDSKKRLICKKTSLCWLLRDDYERISSDRLHRVKATTTFKTSLKKIKHKRMLK